MKKALVVLGVVVLIAAAFWGGTLYADSGSAAPEDFARGDGAGLGGQGGPMASLTDAERAKLQNMTDAERQAFFQEKTGGMAPTGGMRGPGGGAIDGEVIEVADDTLTIKLANGGSQTVYTDGDTVVGYAEGAAQLATGSNVVVIAVPEADGVMTATGILVK